MVNKPLLQTGSDIYPTSNIRYPGQKCGISVPSTSSRQGSGNPLALVTCPALREQMQIEEQYCGSLALTCRDLKPGQHARVLFRRNHYNITQGPLWIELHADEALDHTANIVQPTT